MSFFHSIKNKRREKIIGAGFNAGSNQSNQTQIENNDLVDSTVDSSMYGSSPVEKEKDIMTNKTMLQYFEWYMPADSLHWQRCEIQAWGLSQLGINMVWLPPAYKGAAGKKSVGYDVYDMYDLGEFNQKGTYATKYGTKDEYIKAVESFKSQGIEVLADVVLNHMMGADEAQTVIACEDAGENREEEIGGEREISAWTRFTFPGRQGKYSSFTWDYTNFSGTDWDEKTKKGGIYRFQGKNWSEDTDDEKANFDYLMGVDLDFDNSKTTEAVTNWGKWYLDTVKPSGFRLDAVKHISSGFYKEWMANMRSYKGEEFFAVGEYWSSDLEKLKNYLNATGECMSLFDVPLHFAFVGAATSNGGFDMSKLLENSLCKATPFKAVTFVDNHDTQPGQSLSSFVPEWFKPIAYALILLQESGLPCVFYGDLYGIPHDKIKPVPGLRQLIKLRKSYAYGTQTDYFDDSSIVGFTRSGDDGHSGSGLAVLMTDSDGGKKRMKVSQRLAGQKLYNALGGLLDPVTLDNEGYGEFYVDGGSVSVWVTEQAYRDVRTSVEF